MHPFEHTDYNLRCHFTSTFFSLFGDLRILCSNNESSLYDLEEKFFLKFIVKITTEILILRKIKNKDSKTTSFW